MLLMKNHVTGPERQLDKLKTSACIGLRFFFLMVKEKSQTVFRGVSDVTIKQNWDLFTNGT